MHCVGDGSSCAGCDGVANSGTVYDACGVCGGTSTSCTGVQYLVQDACGDLAGDYIFATDTAYVSCCSMDGLSGERDSEEMGGSCSDLMTYGAALNFCEAAGMRLCSPEELPVTCGTGCSYDYEVNYVFL